MCGIFGISYSPDAARLTSLGLFALQHRGQESAGISTMDTAGELITKKQDGLVTDALTESTLKALTGTSAIGHVRYSTAGGRGQVNNQPFTARIGGTPVAMAHNGNIVNAPVLREELEAQGAIFQGTTDTEVVLHLLARSTAQTFEDRLYDALNQMKGAFSLLFLTPTHLYAIVDPVGYRPLVLGKITGQNQEKDSWVFSSESCGLDLIDAKYIRDVAPGEMVVVDLVSSGLSSKVLQLTEDKSRKERQARCIFEHIYFARPDSYLWQETSVEARLKLGKALARQCETDADIVIGVPDSGLPLAQGFSEASGIPLKTGFIRNRYVGRTFIEPTQNVRNLKVRMKLNPIASVVSGKKLIVIDDSIVRGTTSKKIIELLKYAGAKEVHMRVGSPEVKYPCFYGIDTPKRQELLAQKMNLEEMQNYLGADSLAFLSIENMLATMDPVLTGRENPNLKYKGFCISCFNGKYQDRHAQKLGNPAIPHDSF